LLGESVDVCDEVLRDIFGDGVGDSVGLLVSTKRCRFGARLKDSFGNSIHVGVGGGVGDSVGPWVGNTVCIGVGLVVDASVGFGAGCTVGQGVGSSVCFSYGSDAQIIKLSNPQPTPTTHPSSISAFVHNLAAKFSQIMTAAL